MDAILSTLIETQRERNPLTCDMRLRDCATTSLAFRALVALNIRMTQRYGEYRLMMLSEMMDRELESTKDLTKAELEGLLRYTEIEKHDNPKPI